MNDRPKLPRRRAPGWGLLLALLLLPLSAPCAGAAGPAAPAVVAPTRLSEAPGPPVVLGSFRTILGDQMAMIQVAVIVGLIAIFWLTRAIK